jgi:hypothetical protein
MDCVLGEAEGVVDQDTATNVRGFIADYSGFAGYSGNSGAFLARPPDSGPEKIFGWEIRSPNLWRNFPLRLV